MRTQGLRKRGPGPFSRDRQSLRVGGLNESELRHEVDKVSRYSFGRGIVSLPI